MAGCAVYTDGHLFGEAAMVITVMTVLLQAFSRTD